MCLESCNWDLMEALNKAIPDQEATYNFRQVDNDMNLSRPSPMEDEQVS